MIASWLIRKQLPLLDAFRFSSSNVIPVFCISIATALVNILFLLLVIPESLSKEHQTGVRAETTNRFADSVAPRPEGSLLFRHALSWLIPILPKRIFNGNGSSHKDCSMPLTACALFGHLLTMVRAPFDLLRRTTRSLLTREPSNQSISTVSTYMDGMPSS
jgi:hypothetical protein